MNKSDLTRQIAERAGLTRAQADTAVSETLEHITLALSRGERVALPGLGSFSVGERAAREQKNPATGETMHVEAHKTVRFRAASALRQAVKGE